MNPDMLIHPGEVLLEEFIRPHGLTPSSLAKRVGLPPNRITMVVNGKRNITPETAVLLAAAFGTTELFWTNLQTRHDLDKTRTEIPAERIAKAEALHRELEEAQHCELEEAA